MATTGGSLSKTVELLFDIFLYGAEKTFEKSKSAASVYLKALVKCTVLLFLVIFASIILKAITGLAVFAYVGVSLCFALAIVLAIWGAPIGIVIGMLKGETANPVKAGSGYVRGVLTALFTAALAFLYVIEVPIENNPGALPKLLICGTALIISIYLWGSWIPPKMYTLAVMATMFYTTMSLFTPNPLDSVIEELKQLGSGWSQITQSASSATAQQAQTTSRKKVIQLNLSETNWSEQIDIYGHKFECETPGWMEFFLIGSGDRLRVEKGVVTLTQKNGQSKRLSGFPPQFQPGDWAFRLRGAPGPAIVTFLD